MKMQSKGLAALVLGMSLGLGACSGAEEVNEPQTQAVDQEQARAEFLELHTIALADTPYSQNLRIYKHVQALNHALMADAELTPTTLRFAKDADALYPDWRTALRINSAA